MAALGSSRVRGCRRAYANIEPLQSDEKFAGNIFTSGAPVNAGRAAPVIVMRRAGKVLKWSAVVTALLFTGAQAYRPDRVNPAVDERLTLAASTRVPPEVEAILRRSCNDCHSSETVWPWYSNVAPASWFLKKHVDEGRRELSFSEWGSYPKRKRERKLHEMCEQVESGEMPLKSYLPLHPEARLSEEDKRRICEWTRLEEERQPEDAQAPGGR